MERNGQASEHAPGGATAPEGRTAQSLADRSGASGTLPRNGTTRSSHVAGPCTGPARDENLDVGNDDPVPAPDRRGRRMHWTRQDNLDLLRAYYEATDLEQDMVNYRARLEEIWNRKRPHMPKTAQLLSGQVRSVLNRKALTDAELEQLKSEIRDVAQNNTRRSSLPQRRTRRRQTLGPRLVEMPESDMEAKLMELLTKYQEIPLECRAPLPKLKYSAALKTSAQDMNKVLAYALSTSDSLLTTCHIVYCAAVAVCLSIGVSVDVDKTRTNASKQKNDPPWKRRLENKIKLLRKEIGPLHAYFSTETPSRNLIRVAKKISKRLKIKYGTEESTKKLKIHLDYLKQKIAALGCRIRRYNERCQRYQQNQQFRFNQKSFYRALSEAGQSSGSPPDQNTMAAFWSEIWSQPKNHTEEYWLQQEVDRVQNVPQMAPIEIFPRDIEMALKNMGNWKAPGLDGIHVYWWKNFTKSHSVLAFQLNEALNNPAQIPLFFTEGITYMLPKSTNISNPKDYRPVTCLPAVYKILTSILEHYIRRHLDTNSILAREQNGCCQSSKGSTEWLIIDSIVTKHAKQKTRNISIAWVDYRKAFDSVPHSWLLRVLEIYRVNPTIIKLLQLLMSQWRTSLRVNATRIKYVTEKIKIARGIFQGDSLSPLWFCMALNPLSQMLRSSKYGYVLARNPIQKVHHLFYMDDLKLYATNIEQMQGLLELVSTFSHSIQMEFGLEKCAYVHVKGGQMQESENLKLMDESEFAPLQTGEKYKYLGIKQALTIDDVNMRKTIEEQFLNRITKVLKTYLNAKAKITAINTWALPILTNTFGVLNWTNTDLDNLDRKVRTTMTKHRIHHPHASINRLYLPRSRGGRGLKNLTIMHNNHLKKMHAYFITNTYPLHQAIVNIDVRLSPLNLALPFSPRTEKSINTLENEWKQKELHGRYAAALNGADVDKALSTAYLANGQLMPETEGFVQAIQDQVISTRNYRRHIARENLPDDRCRLCSTTSESIQHLSSGCSYLAPRDYLSRHNAVGGIVHQAICLGKGLIEEEKPYYSYLPERLLENDQVKVYWDMPLTTDRLIRHNKPDILVIYKNEQRASVIDIIIPLDDNIRKARMEKITKYQELSEELKRMYGLVKVEILPVVISSNGLIDKLLSSNLQRMELADAKRTIALMQKSVLLATCATIRRVLAHN